MVLESIVRTPECPPTPRRYNSSNTLAFACSSVMLTTRPQLLAALVHSCSQTWNRPGGYASGVESYRPDYDLGEATSNDATRTHVPQPPGPRRTVWRCPAVEQPFSRPPQSPNDMVGALQQGRRFIAVGTPSGHVGFYFPPHNGRPGVEFYVAHPATLQKPGFPIDPLGAVPNFALAKVGSNRSVTRMDCLRAPIMIKNRDAATRAYRGSVAAPATSIAQAEGRS